MPSATLSQSNNSTCSTCKKEFKNSKGLARHQQNVRKYNKRHQEIDELPVNTVVEFKQILVAEIHKKLPLNFRSMGKKLFSIPCPESIFFSIFAGNIHYYSKARGIYRCIFRGHDAYQVLSKILNSDQWGKRIYSQRQQTYVVCLDPIPWNVPNNLQDQSKEIDPLEQLLQSTTRKQHKTIRTRRPRFLRGEILIEWKKKMSKVNGTVNMAGYIHFNFYIAQLQNVQ
ncbi:uncharacterized protein OCT59_019563 [Rhizophagus irregularis]|uniref:C2H2-type domain-containing protein n=3 Tax=Rhizophagus irregularis TaxID=588596 RepID=A0A015IYC3_RHIIW|nr:hypothetical protein RirG_197460 [Rhizophagus irregularis DAOM 197198w]EXX62267.1 hypothetical protein RirG_163390 [Rhizophagus irregularis DAOM 197198w]EXX64872.1 hypothetical protein RirG_138680 [Rhizophagus irregularis DAOM 197198w]UZO27365.1 hypothetical protein OCT59_019563 [Rhizophagus irregularis]CAG8728943.1 20772_t:CDS:1 [Rhizophagus irregularis]